LNAKTGAAEENFIIITNGLRKVFISKTKGARKEIEAVKGVDLAVKRGEIFGFLGPNGAGKSTTQRMLATLLCPTSGTAKIMGYDLQEQQEEIRKNIGYVSQAGGSDTYASGLENLILQAQLYGLNIETAKKYTNEFVDRFQMSSFIERQVSTYSGGQKRRLDVAIGMVHHPQLLLLDEPTSGLDPQSRAYLWEEIRRLKTDGITMFLTTQYMDEADKLCDSISIIDNGTIMVKGTPAELKSSIGEDMIVFGFSSDEIALKTEALLKEKLESEKKVLVDKNFVHLYTINGEQTLPEILRLFDANNLNAQSATLTKPSLDDVFLKYTGRSLREDRA